MRVRNVGRQVRRNTVILHTADTYREVNIIQVHELHQPKGGGRCNTNGTLVDKRDERFSRAHIGTTQDGKICRRSRKLVEKELGRINMSSVHANLRLPTAIQ